jgi:hypothetical protein
MASLTSIVNDMTTRSQLALKFMSLEISRAGVNVDPEEIVTRCYRLSDEFLARARQDWRDQRAPKNAGGYGGNIAEAKTDEAMHAPTP